MPEVPVVETPVAKPDLDFGIPDQPVVVVPGGGDAQPRDDKGRFVAPETDDVDGGEEPETPEPDGAEPEVPVVIAPLAGLTLDDDVAPTFDHDGKFIGGKFLGKYDTLDGALTGHKNALKRIGQLEHENNELRTNGATSEVPPYVFDPHSMTDDQLANHVAGEIGEMTVDQRIEFDENPVLGMAKIMTKVNKAMSKVTESTQQWEKATRDFYTQDQVDAKGAVVRKGMAAELFDNAKITGAKVYADFKAGRVGPAEIQALIGVGIMVRDGKLSDDQPVVRRKLVGKSSVAHAAVPVRTPKGPADPRAEQKRELKEMQDAAYG